MRSILCEGRRREERLFWSVLLAALVLAGCGVRQYRVDAAYQETGAGRGALAEAGGVTLYVAPVMGGELRLWYETGSRVWTLKRSPTEMVREALVQGLTSMGLGLTERADSADGLLEVRIRWFAPYGHSPYSAAVIVSLCLRDAGGVIWRGRVQAGRVKGQQWPFVFGARRRLEAVLSEVLTEAVDQLRWKPGFHLALRRLQLKGSAPSPAAASAQQERAPGAR